MRGAECLSDISVGGGAAAAGQSGHRCAAGAAASRHAEAAEHDDLHDPQRVGGVERITETRLKLRRVSAIRGNYSTVSTAVYCIDPSSTFTNGILSHYFVSEAGINDQNP